MNGLYIISSAFIVSLVFTLLFALISRKGPWRGILLFFLVIFFVGWSAQLWIIPFGPVWWGISWLTLLGTVLIFSLLIIALINPGNLRSEKKGENTPTPGIMASIFFWCLLIFLILSIIIGYYRIPSIN